MARVGFSCRLPVVTRRTGAEETYQGGFISFPAASYSQDPDGTISTVSGYFVSKRAPVLTGFSSPPSFDSAAGRWVPSTAAETSPDGSTYAYTTRGDANASLIHLVNVSQGTEKIYRVQIPNPSQAGLVVEDDDGTGVFFSQGIVEGHPYGVWRLDLQLGSVTQVAQVSSVLAVRNNYAWAGTVDPHDPTPPQGGGPLLFDTIYEVNLASHAQTTWYYTQGRSDTLLGFASGDLPVVSVADAPDFDPAQGEVRLIDHPGTSGGEDNGELLGAGTLNLAWPHADGDRLWLGGGGGIYLYTAGGGLQKVYAFTGGTAGGQTMAPAGVCR